MKPGSSHYRLELPARLDLAGLEQFSIALDKGVAAGLPLLLCGSVDGEFCRGLDLDGQHVDLSRARNFAALLIRLWQAPAPTIALVDGAAMGGGLGLAAACDRVICTERATFALPELLWGFVPAMIWPLITTRMRDNIARWWIITGRARNAGEALADGMVDEVVEPANITAVIQRRVKECSRADAAAIPML